MVRSSFVLGWVVVASLAGAQGKPLTAKQVYEKARGSVVRIKTTSHEKGVAMAGSGSGFFFESDEVVATAYHVVKDAETLAVIDAQGKTYAVKGLAVDRAADVALLWLNRHSKRKFLVKKDFAGVSVGDTVFTIGDSLGLLANSLSQGIVSGKRKAAGVPLIQITAAISPGNSGGPVLDDLGRVVGIVSFSLTQGQSLNLAVAMNEATKTWRAKGGWGDGPAFLAINSVRNMPEVGSVGAKNVTEDREPGTTPSDAKITKDEAKEELARYMGSVLGAVICADAEWMVALMENPRRDPDLVRSDLVRIKLGLDESLSPSTFERVLGKYGPAVGAKEEGIGMVAEALTSVRTIFDERLTAYRSLAYARLGGNPGEIEAAAKENSAFFSRTELSLLGLIRATSMSKWAPDDSAGPMLPAKAHAAFSVKGMNAYLDMSLPFTLRIRYAFPESPFKRGDRITALSLVGSSSFTPVSSFEDLKQFVLKNGPMKGKKLVFRVLRDDQTFDIPQD